MSGFPKPSGSSGVLTLVQRTILTAPQATIPFTGIPQTGENLVLEFMGRFSDAAVSAHLLHTFNGDAGLNYNTQNVNGTGAVAAAAVTTGQSAGRSAEIPAATDTANVAGNVCITIPGYARTTFFKSWTAEAFSHSNGNLIADIWAGFWASTAAITSITLADSGGGNFIAGTVASLYLQS